MRCDDSPISGETSVIHSQYQFDGRVPGHGKDEFEIAAPEAEIGYASPDWKRYARLRDLSSTGATMTLIAAALRSVPGLSWRWGGSRR
jgi:hypothetical protein